MKNKGFTLLEILIVVSVLAILIGIIVPRIAGFQQEANLAKAKAELKTLQAAVESYKTNVGSYPENLASRLTTGLPANTPKILSASLDDPFAAADTSYGIDYSDDNTYYVIFSEGVSGTGAATVADTGIVTATGTGICVTNGTTGC